MQGKLIVLEGVEGAGKSTQLQRLQLWLQDHPLVQTLQSQEHMADIIITREPGGTILGKQLRELLLKSDGEKIMPTAELLLYAADRAQHVETMILPALERGCWVLCDRYMDSTVAYQGYGRELHLGIIDQLNQIATDGLMGDLTLWLNLDVEEGLARTRKRGVADRMELSEVDFHRRVQTGFGALAEQYPDRIAVIDAHPAEAAVAEQIQQVVEQRLKQWYQPYLKV